MVELFISMRRTAHQWEQADADILMLDRCGWKDARNFNQIFYTKFIDREEYIKRRDRCTVIPKPPPVPPVQVLKSTREWEALDKECKIVSYHGWRDKSMNEPIDWEEYTDRRDNSTCYWPPWSLE